MGNLTLSLEKVSLIKKSSILSKRLKNILLMSNSQKMIICIPDILVDYRMKLATQLVVNKKRHSA